MSARMVLSQVAFVLEFALEIQVLEVISPVVPVRLVVVGTRSWNLSFLSVKFEPSVNTKVEVVCHRLGTCVVSERLWFLP